jgi:hypothetical protein
MKPKIDEMTELEMQQIRGGGDSDYGQILASAGGAAVAGAFVLTAAPVFLVALAVVGAAAVVQGAYMAYNDK